MNKIIFVIIFLISAIKAMTQNCIPIEASSVSALPEYISAQLITADLKMPYLYFSTHNLEIGSNMSILFFKSDNDIMIKVYENNDECAYYLMNKNSKKRFLDIIGSNRIDSCSFYRDCLVEDGVNEVLIINWEIQFFKMVSLGFSVFEKSRCMEFLCNNNLKQFIDRNLKKSCKLCRSRR